MEVSQLLVLLQGYLLVMVVANFVLVSIVARSKGRRWYLYAIASLFAPPIVWLALAQNWHGDRAAMAKASDKAPAFWREVLLDGLALASILAVCAVLALLGELVAIPLVREDRRFLTFYMLAIMISVAIWGFRKEAKERRRTLIAQRQGQIPMPKTLEPSFARCVE